MANNEEFVNQLKNRKIGVLYGGISSEREISILSGKAVLSALKKMKLNVCGIDVNRNVEKKIKKEKIDIAYLALHGQVVEDGTLQGMLEILGIAYTGSGVLASSLSMDKNISKNLFKCVNILTPQWNVLKKNEILSDINYPIVVKPVACGSALGVTIAKNFKEFTKAAKKAFEYDSEIIIEQFVRGKEITVGVLTGKALPVIEIVPTKSQFYDYKAKYQKGCSKHIIPANISKKAYNTAQGYAEKIYKFFRCKAVCRVDMIVDKNDKVWVLENNTIPGMTETSLLPDASRVAGYNFGDLVLKIIESSIRNA
ncbi:MAG: D-alanine--D-alanine ligase [Endomicrobium sp.]|jgi:D-alanine-D-alanine ligase|nr:D-alanine--D-alanine ligase [Endomicrobium sp.]